MVFEKADNWSPVKSKIERFLRVAHPSSRVKARDVEKVENWLLV